MTVAAATTIAKLVTRAVSGTKSGIAAQKVVRVSGLSQRFSGMTTASMTIIVTKFVATTDNGRSWRGRRTCLTRLAWPRRLEHAIWIADWKKSQKRRPGGRKSG